MLKRVISKHKKHYGSTRYYFFYGKKAAYKITENSLVGQYAVIKGATIDQQCRAIVIEDSIVRELKQGIDLLSSVIPSMSLK